MDYDVVVIGAGIHGAAVAQAAAANGYRTLVLEQYSEPAQGTSSKSSSLIHGGLRYLESGRLRLVRECLVERRRLLRNAPHLVQLRPFHIPVYRHTGRPAWLMFLGLSLYSLLSGHTFRRVPRAQWSTLDGLRTAGLQTVFQYPDGQTDGALLTRAVLASATSLGAHINYNCSFTGARCYPDGCDIDYTLHGHSHRVRAQTLVNGGGPWVNEVLQRVEPA
ncbi:MAG: FAD-dependent oxidoreductase, partial [Thiogranum sp.]|nr:FAD-dependent oxidoreductase [Thiogranum sp.]